MCWVASPYKKAHLTSSREASHPDRKERLHYRHVWRAGQELVEPLSATRTLCDAQTPNLGAVLNLVARPGTFDVVFFRSGPSSIFVDTRS